MEKQYTVEDGKLVETVTLEKIVRSEHDLNELIKIRLSIDQSEAEYLATSQAEKDKFDALIAECKKKGIKTKEELSVTEEVIQP